jgi:diguanylate cyclase (GGDEF)-like protein/PAS domain S-box-containing protein
MSLHAALSFTLIGVAGGALAWEEAREPTEKLPWIGVGVPLAIVAMAFILWEALILEQYHQVGRTVDAVAFGVRDYIQQRIETDIRGLSRITKRWELTGRPSHVSWTEDATVYISHTSHAQSVAWVDPSLHVRWVVPASGRDVLNRLIADKHQDAVSIAMRTHDATMSRPIVLEGEEKAGLVYIPIYRRNQFEGFVVATFQINTLLGAVPSELASGYNLEVFENKESSKVRTGTELYRQGVVDHELEQTFTRTMPLAMHGTTWYLLITPLPGTVRHFTSPLPRIIFLTGLLIAAAFSSFYYNEQRLQAARSLLEQEIVERRAIEEALRQSEARLIEAQSIARIGFWEYDISTEKVFWSKEMLPLLNVGLEDAIPTLKDLLRRFHPDDVPQFLSVVEQAVQDGKSYEFDIRMLQNDGSITWFHNIGRIIPDENAQAARLQGTFYDITERKGAENDLRIAKERLEETNIILRQKQRELLLANERLVQLATTDGLTGLKNHRTFQTRFKVEFDRAIRYTSPLSVLLLDVDHFKTYNDSYGHPAGDEILVKVARLLEKTCRSSDMVARYGGEEFAIILTQTDSEHAVEAAERIRSLVVEHHWERRPITLSIGVATLEPGMDRTFDLISAADTALYASKAAGRNRVTRFEDMPPLTTVEKPERLSPTLPFVRRG